MKKLIKWGLIGFVILIVIGAVASGGDKKDSSSQKSGQTQEKQAQETKKEATPVPSAEEVTTAIFISEFDENQLAAEEKYKGKLIEFTAYIKNISEDIMGTPFLSLQPTTDEYYLGTTIKCSFKEKAELTSVKNGQQVVLQGEVDTQSLGIISIENCKIVNL